MDRTVPQTGSEEIELYMRTYYSLLRSTRAIKLESLVESHMAMESSLHVAAREAHVDISALVYASLRLPSAITEVNRVLLGQLEDSFIDAGFPVTEWERVYAPGRRRRSHYDGAQSLAVFIASRSDIDDLVPILTAYQIEWNKLHGLLRGEVPKLFLAQNRDRNSRLSESELKMMSEALQMTPEDLERLEIVWGGRFMHTLGAIAQKRKQFEIQLLAGSLADYRRATARWWTDLNDQSRHEIELDSRPVYFVSSNTHSLLNLLTGFAAREEAEIVKFIEARGHEALLADYRALFEAGDEANKNNFLYYALRKFLGEAGREARERFEADVASIGIRRIPSKHGFDVETQIIELNKLRPEWIDPRLAAEGALDWMTKSDAVIFNVDYPLGLGAYEILARLSEGVSRLMGVYVMGKAATLNGRIGDVSISNVVHDEHSKNTYLFNNCFTAQHIAPYMTYGTVLDNQKAISALGTFLQNPSYMSVFYQEGYTVIEMEAGPYLSSIYELVRPKRHPQNEIVTLYGAPFDIGFLHYASDTPFTKGHNLGAGSLDYRGIEPTYATAIAILQRIFSREAERMGAKSAAHTGAELIVS